MRFAEISNGNLVLQSVMDELAEVAGTDPLKAQLERTKKAEKALRVKKAAIKAQRAQQQLRAAKAPTKP